MSQPENIIAELDPSFLHEQLVATDKFATENVRQSRGGPFGAALHIIDLDTNQTTQVGGLAANAVLKTGIASQHAEAEVLSPENQKELRAALERLKAQGRTNLAIICTSSGQSCPACQAKQEIVARDLSAKGLLPKGRFVVTYGATFEDTAQIAGFNDAPYVLDNLLRLTGNGHDTMVEVQHRAIDEVPEHIRRSFMIAQADNRHIAILDGANVAKTGRDHRDRDLFASAEVTAIREACGAQKQMDLEQPWLLGNRPEHPDHAAVLYTTVKNPGPLLLAEAQWAGVAKIVCIGGLPHHQRDMRETPDVANIEFGKACWGGYNTPASYLTVIRLMPFNNEAQQEWREKLAREGNAILYNGLAADPALQKLEPLMRQRFTGHVMLCDVPDVPARASAKPANAL